LDPGLRKGLGATEPNRMEPHKKAHVVIFKITKSICHKVRLQARCKDIKD